MNPATGSGVAEGPVLTIIIAAVDASVAAVTKYATDGRRSTPEEHMGEALADEQRELDDERIKVGRDRVVQQDIFVRSVRKTLVGKVSRTVVDGGEALSEFALLREVAPMTAIALRRRLPDHELNHSHRLAAWMTIRPQRTYQRS